MSDDLRELADRTAHTRTLWLQQHGVPISHEFANFAESLGELIEAVRRTYPICAPIVRKP